MVVKLAELLATSEMFSDTSSAANAVSPIPGSSPRTIASVSKKLSSFLPVFCFM